LSLVGREFLTPPPANQQWRTSHLWDINGDGLEDIVLRPQSTSGSRVVGYALAQPDGTYSDPVAIWVDGFNWITVGMIPGEPEPVALCRQSEGGALVAYRAAGTNVSRVWTESTAAHHGSSSIDDTFGRAGDLDNDGFVDLVLFSTQDRFVIRWSSRQVFTRYQVFYTDGPAFVFPVRDYNGDGFVDVLVNAPALGGLTLYPGFGMNTLGGPVRLNITIPDPTRGMVDIGNFDANPATDLVRLVGDSLEFLLNFTGTDPQAVIRAVPIGDTVAVRALLNRSGEGHDDIILEQALLSPFGARREHHWHKPLDSQSVAVPVRVVQASSQVRRALDVNADGILDIVTFADGWFATLGESDDERPFGNSSRSVSGNILHVNPIDLDDDGLPEVVVAGPGTPVIINPRDHDIDPMAIDANGASFMSIAVTLGVGAARPDHLVFAGTSLAIIPIIGDGSLGPTTYVPSPTGNRLYGLAAADFDGDGIQDIAAADFDANLVHVYRGVSNGGLELISSIFEATPIKPAAADMNGDGLADLILGSSNGGQIRVLLGDGLGGFALSQSIPTTTGYWIEVEDLDRDGYADIVAVRNSSNQFRDCAQVFFGSSTGIETSPVVLPVSGSSVEFAIADLDGNGLSDLIVIDYIFGANLFNPHDGSGIVMQVEPRVFVSAGRLPHTTATTGAFADVDGDGRLDVLTSSGEDRFLRVHYGRADSCLADFNSDGSVNFFDIAAFVQSFSAQSPDADLAAPFGEWSFFDIAAFLQAFNAGCP
jgi:hypothetical protein